MESFAPLHEPGICAIQGLLNNLDAPPAFFMVWTVGGSFYLESEILLGLPRGVSFRRRRHLSRYHPGFETQLRSLSPAAHMLTKLRPGLTAFVGEFSTPLVDR